ncbi:MAG: Asp-tRNA(Asn)/Glu-tRNA(Gln) amidotransferase GatCAB subunit A [Actinomycetota bacterium]
MGLLKECADRIASGRTSSVQETQAAIERVEASQPMLNAFTFVAAEQALSDARARDRSKKRGCLHGVPIAVKDLIDVAGMPATGCSRFHEGRVALRDAAVVKVLRSAGAVIVGKTNMHELAFGATGDTSSFGPVGNPWDTERMAGGSSSGSAAAVAAQVVPLALGTDTGGSVRIPASLCGVSALKTTFNLIPTTGVMALARTFDTVGPIAQDARDLMLALTAMAGPRLAAKLSLDELDALERLEGITVGLAVNGSFDTIDAAVQHGVEDAVSVLETLGANIVEIALPDAERARDTWSLITLSEFLEAHEWREESLLSDEMRFLLQAARSVALEQMMEARRAVRESFLAWRRAFDTVSVVALPATPVAAPKHFASTALINGVDTPVHGGLLSSKTRQINVVGMPAICVPCGQDGTGMPFGLQLAGPDRSESLLLRVADAYQRVTDWHRRTPPNAF